METISGHQETCDFNNITAEEIITYKFAVTIQDKKARDKFIKGTPKIQLILETIELDNYNTGKTGENTEKQKPRKVSTNSSSEEEQIGHTNLTRKRKPTFKEQINFSIRNCRFCRKPNLSLEHICPARRAQCNNCKKM